MGERAFIQTLINFFYIEIYHKKTTLIGGLFLTSCINKQYIFSYWQNRNLALSTFFIIFFFSFLPTRAFPFSSELSLFRYKLSQLTKSALSLLFDKKSASVIWIAIDLQTPTLESSFYRNKRLYFYQFLTHLENKKDHLLSGLSIKLDN